MCLLYLRVTILSLLFCQTRTQDKCNNSICNGEAICILKDDKPTCDCVGRFFKGEFCSEAVDHCTPNPCQNGGTCHPYPGHYYCECAAGYSAQKCTSRQDTFTGLHLHYDHIAPIGKEQPLLLIMQSLGSVETLMDFFTPDYIIDGVAFTSSSGHFIPSSDLKALSKKLGIRHSDGLPYNSGFYRISRATFWKLGIHTMALDLDDFGLSEENFFTEHFDIIVYDPSGVLCLPVIHLPNCLNPRKALHMDIVTFNFVEPIVDKRCAEHSHLKIKWSVRNYIDSVVLYKFPDDASSVLTIPPYTMWFNYRDDYVQSYLIHGEVTEISSLGSPISKTVLRCYVFVDSKPTTARILGGTYREVNVTRGFVVDGSISRDYARRPNHDQELKYRWSCQSEDRENPHCLKDMGSGSRLNIPAEAFALDQAYTFTLRVRSTINIYSTHRTSQQIKAVSGDPLLIHFTCLRNCEHNKFAAGKVVHLRVECLGCPPGDVAYSVRNEQDAEVSNSHRVILTEESRKEIRLKAVATLGSRKGTTSIKLTINSPPAKGNCKISPSSGFEYQTVFKITCFGYEDDGEPIDYKYKAGNTTLDHSGNDTLSTRLFPTSGQNCEINISICDDIGACTEVKLQAALSPLFSNGSLLGLLSRNDTNLRQLIENGDRSSAITLIRTVIPHISSTESLEVAKHIVESLRKLELGRLLAAEQVLTVGSHLVETVELSSASALLISELFSNVSNGLLHSIQNGEVLELSLETHEQMIGELAQSMAKVATQVEEFPMVHDAEPIPPDDPFKENYSDYGELDMEDVVDISNWLQSFSRMHRCLQVMGFVSAFIQLPDETPLTTKRKGITSTTLVVDKSEAVSLSWNESTTYVSLPDKVFKGLKGKEIAIQLTTFVANPFWWNPEQYSINTEVLSVGAYTRDLKSLNSNYTRVSFSFFMALRDIEESHVILGSVNKSLDMPVYERLLPAHAVLVVKLLPLDNDIRILLVIGERPRSYMLKEAKIVKASKENVTFFLVNHNNTEVKAFLAMSSRFYVKFSFTMQIRLCLTWNPSSYEWTSEHCSVGSQTNATHIHCSCRHLSMFGAKVHPTFGHLQRSRGIVQHLPLNYEMMGFYLLIIIVFSLITWLTWRQELAKAENLVVLNSKHERRTARRYLVTIYTSGHTNATTTSNVTIQIHGSLSNSQQCTLYSNPCHPLFQRNFQTSFAIFSTTSLGALKAVSLHHDNFGRYPAWNCHMVKVRDEQMKHEYIFLVDKWVSTSDTTLVTLTDRERLQRRIFRDTLVDVFSNWYAQQPICSIRLYGNLRAVEKATIFIARLCVTLMGTIIVFGPTTIFTYEDERETYYSMLLDIGRLLFIAFCCHLVGVVAAILLQYIFGALRPRRANYTLVFDEK